MRSSSCLFSSLCRRRGLLGVVWATMLVLGSAGVARASGLVPLALSCPVEAYAYAGGTVPDSETDTGTNHAIARATSGFVDPHGQYFTFGDAEITCFDLPSGTAHVKTQTSIKGTGTGRAKIIDGSLAVGANATYPVGTPLVLNINMMETGDYMTRIWALSLHDGASELLSLSAPEPAEVPIHAGDVLTIQFEQSQSELASRQLWLHTQMTFSVVPEPADVIVLALLAVPALGRRR